MHLHASPFMPAPLTSPAGHFAARNSNQGTPLPSGQSLLHSGQPLGTSNKLGQALPCATAAPYSRCFSSCPSRLPTCVSSQRRLPSLHAAPASRPCCATPLLTCLRPQQFSHAAYSPHQQACTPSRFPPLLSNLQKTRTSRQPPIVTPTTGFPTSPPSLISIINLHCSSWFIHTGNYLEGCSFGFIKAMRSKIMGWLRGAGRRGKRKVVLVFVIKRQVSGLAF